MIVQSHMQSVVPYTAYSGCSSKYLGVTLKELRYGPIPQHHNQHQPNKVEHHTKEVEVEVLDVHAGVHVPLQRHLIVDRSQAGDGDAA